MTSVPGEPGPPEEGAPGTTDELSALVERLLDVAGATHNRDLIRSILTSSVRFAQDDASRLDLKIVGSAIEEMGDAFRMFAPYHDVPKVTIFGSARVAATSPVYGLARDVARRFAGSGWMVVTGAGPGIMAAGHEGAGRDMAIGVNIRLPFEAEPNPWIAGDQKLVRMKYFFTRKLMLMKESAGFVCLPGGFGTLDETFELLTLVQTGKAEPAPIVLLDTPGGGYWRAFERFVAEHVFTEHLALWRDASLYRITDDVDEAIEEILSFHRNYHSRRYVGDVMVVRLRHAPSDEAIAALSAEFSDLCSDKGIWRTQALAPERAGNDHVDLPRVALEFDRARHSRLRELIDALNALVPAAVAAAAAPVPPAHQTGTYTGGEETESPSNGSGFASEAAATPAADDPQPTRPKSSSSRTMSSSPK